MAYRTTTRSIWSKDGRVIAPRTKLDVVRWPEHGWRLAFLVDDPLRERLFTISDRDLEAHTEPCPA